MIWGRIVWWVRFLAVLWVLAITVGAALQASGWLPDLPKLEPFVWVISLLLIGFENIGTLISRAVRARRGQRDAKIEAALMALLIKLAKDTRTLRFEELGASVYIPLWRDIASRKRHTQKRLKRILRYRPGGYPPQSGVAWTPAKGVVGACWSQRATTYKDWSDVARKYNGTPVTEEVFTQVPSEERGGFDLREFRAIATKYSEILAEPIWHGRRERWVVGVLAIDRPFRAGEATFRPLLHAQETRQIASATASMIGGILKPTADE